MDILIGYIMWMEANMDLFGTWIRIRYCQVVRKGTYCKIIVLIMKQQQVILIIQLVV